MAVLVGDLSKLDEKLGERDRVSAGPTPVSSFGCVVPTADGRSIPDAAILRRSPREIEADFAQNPAKHYPLAIAERSYADGRVFLRI
jgi:hypothetical protein